MSERWWIVEIEAPGDDEPNAIALWEADGAEVALAGFLCPGERGGAPFVTVVTWRTSAEGERSGTGLAALRSPVHADDPDNPESRAGLEQIIETLTAPDTGPIARAKTAIALHLANDGRAAPLASYRPSTDSAHARCGDAGQQPPKSITALFAIERAPEPETAQAHEGKRAQPRGRRAAQGAPESARALQAPGIRPASLEAAFDSSQATGAEEDARSWSQGSPTLELQAGRNTMLDAAQAPAPLGANAVAPMDGPRARVCRARGRHIDAVVPTTTMRTHRAVTPRTGNSARVSFRRARSRTVLVQTRCTVGVRSCEGPRPIQSATARDTERSGTTHCPQFSIAGVNRSDLRIGQPRTAATPLISQAPATARWRRP